mgnify:CR=1 FL=1
MGKNNFTGYIDGDQVPRIFRKNIVGDVAGISTDGLGTWPGSGTIEFTEGEYLNQIAWDMDSLSFFKWDGEDWTRCKGDEAVELFRNRNEYQGNAEKESMKFESYSTAIQPKGSTSVRYPSDVSTGKNSDFVLFDFFDYQPPFRDNQAFSSELPSKVRASQGVQKLGFGDSGKRLFTNETLNQYNRTGTSAELYKRDQTGQFPQLMLYMPDDISDTLKADWEGKAFGSTTAGILSAAGADNFANKIKEATNTIGKNINKAPVEMAASLVTNLAKGITGDQINTGDIFGGVSGVIRNPNVEVLFQKMNLRTFDLSFKLVPYNSDEAYKIEKIIRTFRKCMLPSYSLGGSPVLGMGASDTKDVNENRALEASFIKVPKVCQVTYMRGAKQHPHLPAYKMCAVTDVSVNYTPDGNYAVYNDGQPVATELKVSFMETKLLFSEDVDIYWQGSKNTNSTA